MIDLGVVGTCSFAALFDRDANVVWCCLQRFDGDLAFYILLGTPAGVGGSGVLAIEIEDHIQSEQSCVRNTPILENVLHGERGSVRVTDFAPRFWWRDRPFFPQTLVRCLGPISRSRRIRIRIRPPLECGATAPVITAGSHYLRDVASDVTLRLRCNAPIDYMRDETLFNLSRPAELLLGADGILSEGVAETAQDFEAHTRDYWGHRVLRLAIPFEQQDAGVRASITLKLWIYEPPGAIVAAVRPSIPGLPTHRSIGIIAIVGRGKPILWCGRSTGSPQCAR